MAGRRRSVSIEPEELAVSSPRRSTRTRTKSHVDSPIPKLEEVLTRARRVRSNSIQSLNDIDSKREQSPISSKDTSTVGQPARRLRRSNSLQNKTETKEEVKPARRTTRSSVKENPVIIEEKENTEEEKPSTRRPPIRKVTRSASKSPVDTAPTRSAPASRRNKSPRIDPIEESKISLGVIKENEDEDRNIPTPPKSSKTAKSAIHNIQPIVVIEILDTSEITDKSIREESSEKLDNVEIKIEVVDSEDDQENDVTSPKKSSEIEDKIEENINHISSEDELKLCVDEDDDQETKINEGIKLEEEDSNTSGKDLNIERDKVLDKSCQEFENTKELNTSKGVEERVENLETHVTAKSPSIEKQNDLINFHESPKPSETEPEKNELNESKRAEQSPEKLKTNILSEKSLNIEEKDNLKNSKTELNRTELNTSKKVDESSKYSETNVSSKKSVNIEEEFDLENSYKISDSNNTEELDETELNTSEKGKESFENSKTNMSPDKSLNFGENNINQLKELDKTEINDTKTPEQSPKKMRSSISPNKPSKLEGIISPQKSPKKPEENDVAKSKMSPKKSASNTPPEKHSYIEDNYTFDKSTGELELHDTIDQEKTEKNLPKIDEIASSKTLDDTFTKPESIGEFNNLNCSFTSLPTSEFENIELNNEKENFPKISPENLDNSKKGNLDESLNSNSTNNSVALESIPDSNDEKESNISIVDSIVDKAEKLIKVTQSILDFEEHQQNLSLVSDDGKSYSPINSENIENCGSPKPSPIKSKYLIAEKTSPVTRSMAKKMAEQKNSSPEGVVQLLFDENETKEKDYQPIDGIAKEDNDYEKIVGRDEVIGGKDEQIDENESEKEAEERVLRRSGRSLKKDDKCSENLKIGEETAKEVDYEKIDGKDEKIGEKDEEIGEDESEKGSEERVLRKSKRNLKKDDQCSENLKTGEETAKKVDDDEKIGEHDEKIDENESEKGFEERVLRKSKRSLKTGDQSSANLQMGGETAQKVDDIDKINEKGDKIGEKDEQIDENESEKGSEERVLRKSKRNLKKDDQCSANLQMGEKTAKEVDDDEKIDAKDGKTDETDEKIDENESEKGSEERVLRRSRRSFKNDDKPGENLKIGEANESETEINERSPNDSAIEINSEEKNEETNNKLAHDDKSNRVAEENESEGRILRKSHRNLRKDEKTSEENINEKLVNSSPVKKNKSKKIEDESESEKENDSRILKKSKRNLKNDHIETETSKIDASFKICSVEESKSKGIEEGDPEEMGERKLRKSKRILENKKSEEELSKSDVNISKNSDENIDKDSSGVSSSEKSYPGEKSPRKSIRKDQIIDEDADTKSKLVDSSYQKSQDEASPEKSTKEDKDSAKSSQENMSPEEEKKMSEKFEKTSQNEEVGSCVESEESSVEEADGKEAVENNRDKMLDDLIASYSAAKKRQREENEARNTTEELKKRRKSVSRINFSASEEDESVLDVDSFFDDMASEGSEDTPSVDSNEIIDEGESIGSTDSEMMSSEESDNDSFIADSDDDHDLLSGNDDDYIEAIEKERKMKKKRIITIEDSSGEEETDLENMSTKPYFGMSPTHSINQISSLDSDQGETNKLKNEEISKRIEEGLPVEDECVIVLDDSTGETGLKKGTKNDDLEESVTLVEEETGATSPQIIKKKQSLLITEEINGASEEHEEVIEEKLETPKDTFQKHKFSEKTKRTRRESLPKCTPKSAKSKRRQSLDTSEISGKKFEDFCLESSDEEKENITKHEDKSKKLSEPVLMKIQALNENQETEDSGSIPKKISRRNVSFEMNASGVYFVSPSHIEETSKIIKINPDMNEEATEMLQDFNNSLSEDKDTLEKKEKKKKKSCSSELFENLDDVNIFDFPDTANEENTKRKKREFKIPNQVFDDLNEVNIFNSPVPENEESIKQKKKKKKESNSSNQQFEDVGEVYMFKSPLLKDSQCMSDKKKKKKEFKSPVLQIEETPVLEKTKFVKQKNNKRLKLDTSIDSSEDIHEVSSQSKKQKAKKMKNIPKIYIEEVEDSPKKKKVTSRTQNEEIANKHILKKHKLNSDKKRNHLTSGSLEDDVFEDSEEITPSTSLKLKSKKKKMLSDDVMSSYKKKSNKKLHENIQTKYESEEIEETSSSSSSKLKHKKKNNSNDSFKPDFNQKRLKYTTEKTPKLKSKKPALSINDNEKILILSCSKKKNRPRNSPEPDFNPKRVKLTPETSPKSKLKKAAPSSDDNTTSVNFASKFSVQKEAAEASTSEYLFAPKYFPKKRKYSFVKPSTSGFSDPTFVVTNISKSSHGIKKSKKEKKLIKPSQNGGGSNHFVIENLLSDGLVRSINSKNVFRYKK